MFPEGGQGGEINIPDSTCAALLYTGAVVARTNMQLAALSGVTRLVGDLTISDDVTDLSPLACLSRIDGSLQVYRTHDLLTLAGLDQLHYVSNDVTLGGEDIVGTFPFTSTKPAPNLKLETLEGLGGLLQVGGDLSIYNNDVLTSTGALKLQRLTGALSIYSNHALLNIDGFEALTRLQRLDVFSNPELESLEGLRSVLSVDDSATIDSGKTNLRGLRNLEIARALTIGGDGLTSLTDLAALDRVEDLEIFDSANLHDLRGLERIQRLHNLVLSSTYLETTEGIGPLSEISGALALNYNHSLSSLPGLQAVRTLSSLRVIGNEALVDLSLNSLQSVSNSIEIRDNAVLPNLNGMFRLAHAGKLLLTDNANLAEFDALRLSSIDGVTTIYQNPKLTSLSGLRLLRIAHDLYISENDTLPNLRGLESLQTTGRLTVEANAGLTSLAGLDSLRSESNDIVVNNNPLLTSFGGLRAASNLSVWNNASLTDLAGLENLKELGGLNIASNPKLTSLTGLTSLTSLRSLQVSSCPALVDLRGLAALGTISWEGVSFQNNAALPNCEIEWLVNQVPRLEGPIVVADNNATSACTSAVTPTPPTDQPIEMPNAQVQAVVEGALGCHPFSEVYAEPWQTDPTYASLSPTAALERLKQRLVGTWIGTARTPGFNPVAWTVTVDFSADGTFTSSARTAAEDVPAFYYGGWGFCPGKPWTLANTDSLRIFNGTLDLPIQDPACQSFGPLAQIERVREDATLTRLRFSVRLASVTSTILYDLRRACP